MLNRSLVAPHSSSLVLAVLVAGCAHQPAGPHAPLVAHAAIERYDENDFAGALEQFRAAWANGERGDEYVYDAALAAVQTKNFDEAFVWLDRLQDDGWINELMLPFDPQLAPARADARFGRVLERLRKRSEALAVDVGSGLPRSTPAAEGVDAAALAALVKAADESGSSALIVMRNGKVVAESYFGGYTHRIEAMSATKSIVSLAILMLLRDGKIRSLDEPVWHFFPEWRQGRKQQITVRMLLNHTSGIQAFHSTEEIYASPNFVQLALAAELSSDPGARFAYNNKAVNVLSGIVERVSGQKLDDFLRARLFAPMGIRDVTWSHDRAGNPHAMAGLQIHPLDLAKVGQLLVDGGVWQGKRLLDAKLIAEATMQPGQKYDPTCGLLWWIGYDTLISTLPPQLEQQLVARHAPASLVDELHPILGKPLTQDELRKLFSTLKHEDLLAIRAALDAGQLSVQHEAHDPYGFGARGYLGQYLFVEPAQKLVAVRMMDSMSRGPADKHTFEAFESLVHALTPSR